MKTIVKGGRPGFIRVETEAGDGIDVDAGANAYSALQAAQPFFQALIDASAAPAPKGKSIAPKADA